LVFSKDNVYLYLQVEDDLSLSLKKSNKRNIFINIYKGNIYLREVNFLIDYSIYDYLDDLLDDCFDFDLSGIPS